MILVVIILLVLFLYWIFKDDEPTITKIRKALKESKTEDLKMLNELLKNELKLRD